jgi:hypothetical protein
MHGTNMKKKNKNGLFGYLVEKGQIKNGVKSNGKRCMYVEGRLKPIFPAF